MRFLYGQHTFELLISTILMDVPRDDQSSTDELMYANIAAFVACTLSRASIYVALPIAVLNAAFFVFALVLGGGAPFGRQSPRSRAKRLARWERMSGVARDHIRLLRTLALIPYAEDQSQGISALTPKSPR